MSKEKSQEYRGNGNHEWETVAVAELTFVDRLRVPGGWLYRTTTDNRTINTSISGGSAVVFVPMPEVVKHAV